MSRTGRSMIRSVLTAKDLESFVETYKIPERFSPTLPGPDDSAECTPDRIVLYTLSFSSYGVRYPLSSFKIDLLRHFKVHFSQLHPLGFMRVVHFELSCIAVSGEPSIPLFCMFYKLISDGDWFTFAKRKDSVSQPFYSFMLTSTYPKEWKSRFIFVSAAMIPESPPLRDARAAIEDSIHVLSADEIVQWKRIYKNPLRAFTFSEGILATGGLSPFYSVRPKAFFGKKESNRGTETRVSEGSVQARDSAAGEKDEGVSSGEKENSPGSLQVKSSSDGDEEDLESRLARKRKAGSSHAPIEIPTAPSSSRVRDKSSEVRVARIAPTFEISPHHATRTNKPSRFEGFASRSPLAPLFADALPAPYVPKCKITQSSVVGTPETAWDFLTHANEGLKNDLKTSQTVATELRCQVVDVERKLQEEKGAGAMLEKKDRAWAREMQALAEEKEELAAELKHQRELDSVSQKDLDMMYAEYGMTSDDNQRLAKEKHWLITEGFGVLLTVISQSEEFKSSVEQVYRAYRDVGYQEGLKDGYAYSAQGLGRKETPLYNSKAKKRLSKLEKEFGGKTPALLEKILERPMMSIDELKVLLTPAGPSSPKSLSGGNSQ
ncbi:hypothetical protein HanOQP8_Chr13g0484531 [Helianthus annuus]|nr:hypothetical protein HanOQP8_Chr13g0484531 [Helianthus annuus]